MNDPRVLALFQQQYGVASHAQLVALAPARAVTRARDRGAIVPVIGKVYTLVGAEPSFEARCMAVLLHFGDSAYLSGTTAAALLGARSLPRNIVVVTTHSARHVDAVPDWVQVRHTAWREAGDVITRADGLRLSSPLRTLLDLAAQFNEYRFGRLAEDFWHLGLASPDEASDYLAQVRRSGRRGVRRLEAWLEKVRGRMRPSQSSLELDVIDAIRDVGLPEPERQYPLRLPSGEIVHIDVAWPDVRFGVEPGHSWWHGGDLKQRADMARDRACGEVGWDIKRFDEEMRRDLMAAARQIKNLYGQRRLLIAAS